MANRGFENEDCIRNLLNDAKFETLNENLQDFLQFMFNNSVEHDDIIKCRKKAGHNKSDLKIQIHNETHTVSIKMGAGNSVHQEPVEEFINFLRTTYSITESFENDLKGLIKNRVSASQFKKKYPDKIDNIKTFFRKHKKELIIRFVIKGIRSTSTPEFIYYGDADNGYWDLSEAVINWLINEDNESRGVIPVGRLTFQAWNRNLNGGNLSEHKRGVIQLKWGTIGKDLKKIMHDKNE
jgi:hypothetical protein